MWSRIETLIDDGYVLHNPAQGSLHTQAGHRSLYRESRIKYSHLVSHPDTVKQVREMVGPAIVTAHVGNAYWPWLMAESGVKVHYLMPKTLFGGGNWLEHNGRRVYRVPARELTSTVRAFDTETLFLAPPEDKEQAAARLLREYQGPRCVWMGLFPPKSMMLREVMELWVPIVKERPAAYWQMEPFEIVTLVRPRPRRLEGMETQWIPFVPTPSA